jgi:AcrR family transcriptional regulator
MSERSDPRETILAAAGQRILHYGYNKTTMTEIAADCDMSAGNIYRFFPAKIDIAEAMTRSFAAETHQAYMAIVRDGTLTPTQKLQAFFTYRLERNFRLFERHPKLVELADIIARERPDYIVEERALERRHLEKILQEGAEEGAFCFDAGVTILADLVQCATMKFRYPQLWTTERFEALDEELKGVIGLLLRGLLVR